MSSGWFNPTEPASATKILRKQGSYHNFSWVQVGSTLLNLLEPLSTWEKKDHMIPFHMLGWFNPVWGGSPLLNLHDPSRTWGNKDDTKISHELFYIWSFFHNNSAAQAVWIYWTILKSWEIVLWSLFLQLLGSSSSLAGLNDTKLIRNYVMILLPTIISSSLDRWNHPKLMKNYPTYDPCSFNYSVLRAGLVLLNHPNSWEFVLWSFFPQLLCSSSFSAGLNHLDVMRSVVQAGSAGLREILYMNIKDRIEYECSMVHMP